jgi:hypothetical protein
MEGSYQGGNLRLLRLVLWIQAVTQRGAQLELGTRLDARHSRCRNDRLRVVDFLLDFLLDRRHCDGRIMYCVCTVVVRALKIETGQHWLFVWGKLET